MTADVDFEELADIQAEVDRLKSLLLGSGVHSPGYQAVLRIDALLREINERENPRPRFT